MATPHVFRNIFASLAAAFLTLGCSNSTIPASTFPAVTVMIFSLPGRSYTRVSDPVNLVREAREHLRRSSVPVDKLMNNVILVSTVRSNQGITLVSRDEGRGRGWTVEMNTFGEPSTHREANQAELSLPAVPNSSDSPVLLSRGDGTYYPLSEADARAKQFLKKSMPSFNPEGKDRVFRLRFDGNYTVAYLEEDHFHEIQVTFSHEGTPLSSASIMEPD